MARWQDVAEADRARKIAVREAADAMAHLELMRAFIKESGQMDAFLEWYAKRVGIWEMLYTDLWI